MSTAVWATSVSQSRRVSTPPSWALPTLQKEGVTVSTSGKVVVSDRIEQIQESFSRTITRFPDLLRLKRELEEILRECSMPDWNGYDAKSVDRLSAGYAYRFLKKLPKGISYPELVPEPNGDIAMIWHQRGYHLVIGVDCDGHIAWGGTGPDGRIYGDAKFAPESDIPEILVSLLHTIEGTR